MTSAAVAAEVVVWFAIELEAAEMMKRLVIAISPKLMMTIAIIASIREKPSSLLGRLPHVQALVHQSVPQFGVIRTRPPVPILTVRVSCVEGCWMLMTVPRAVFSK